MAAVSMSMAALMTSRKIPIVITVIGRVRMRRIGRR